jgi:excisionase family DNA binding protein
MIEYRRANEASPERSGMEQARFLSAREVGVQLGLKPSRVYELAHAGALPVVRLGRRMWFPRRGLEALEAAAVERALAVQRLV